jgi:hypothetical protein
MTALLVIILGTILRLVIPFGLLVLIGTIVQRTQAKTRAG